MSSTPPSASPPAHGLNLAQQEAVNYMHGPCLVLAGAGSGKTRVITHKIGRLIQAGLPPQEIAAITFTNKAAAEMRERAKKLIGQPARGVLICTFHALGVRMLRQDGEVLGLKKQFSILDSDDVTSILKDAGGSTDAATARQWQWTISAWKNSGLNAAQAEAQAATDEDRLVARVMARYEERLTAYQSVDFDDLIGLPLKLLREHDAVRDKWQASMGHVLVDEYQDTNATQYEVLKLLVGARGRFTAVGDDDQSIYGWRGATLDNLKKLPLDYPQLKVVKLEQNYRSTSAILRAANNVIAPNPKLFPKTLFSELGEGEPVRVVDCDSEEHEAERVVARIQSLRAEGTLQAVGGQHKEWGDFCVLYRANHMAKPFEKAFRKANIPYKVSGGQSFFDRAEIKDLCSWMVLMVNNDNNAAFIRAIKTPKRGIGHTTLGALSTFAEQYKLSLFESLFSSSLGAVLPAKAVGSLHEFGRYLNDLEYRARRTVGAEDARAFLTTWLKEIDYEKHIYDSEDSEKVAAARWTNVMDFCDWMAQRCGGQIDDSSGAVVAAETKTMLEVVQTIALLSTISEREGDQNVVTLSTLHAAKGLEWPHVVLAGVNEGLLPFKLDDDDGTDAARTENIAQRLEEERRLMYVGITRAQYTLAVNWLRRRKKGRDTVAGIPSRFIAEMGLDKATVREDPREKIRALRAEFAKRAADSAEANQLAEAARDAG
ncbi:MULTISPECIES: UvrD-helicase domain-containing protein [unclassified Polaromonas]|jgi:ATP-dependent DNA helicase Rep|uniref:ATP-dependent helicase n=3 Tax=Polaromonas TaxID=52972 RepID=UPI000BD81A02|nr:MULTISPECIES: UvrD-helicase domain-containing protein [unclassified Polaromonas]OYY34346.1 MAG: ATP-dependent DNA helicase Rep [Polaromonas sp. 35-63-35]OYZ17846.1 MAG: ATP-dependent DNA helicase Rep [Polaromonas sp. 16-63-31]OYZ77244.1 MAG: ATP-dependent DNA helicase Rep [Polaromonas sp. 24-63-21]OZA48176.1 MAG: ATP-dependent DNA helicase Rep [Polaromonas sp. 17-63-33]OZA86702.1 MAG: ATP-dependent DNA helicase Rep [Polaromonas sp. 39-63-25]